MGRVPKISWEVGYHEVGMFFCLIEKVLNVGGDFQGSP